MNPSRKSSAHNLGDQQQPEATESRAEERGERPMEPLLLRPTEVATLLGLGRSTIFALLAAGDLPVIRIGRSVRVPRAALERWIDERTDRVPSHGDVQGPPVRDLRG